MSSWFTVICILTEVNDENSKTIMEAFEQNGEVSFYTNVFMGMADELSGICTLRSEEEVREYLKKDAQERFDVYLRGKIAADDYLLATVLEFVKDNGNCKYPSKDEMRELERAAEAKRVAELPADAATMVVAPKTNQDMMREIMELAEEIFESRRLVRPEDIFCPDEPYHDRLHVENEDFSGMIEWDGHYGCGDCSDYSVRGQLRNDYDDVSFRRYRNGEAGGVLIKKWRDERLNLTKEQIITVHKAFVGLAEREGIEFISEIDYEKLA